MNSKNIISLSPNRSKQKNVNVTLKFLFFIADRFAFIKGQKLNIMFKLLSDPHIFPFFNVLDIPFSLLDLM